MRPGTLANCGGGRGGHTDFPVSWNRVEGSLTPAEPFAECFNADHPNAYSLEASAASQGEGDKHFSAPPVASSCPSSGGARMERRVRCGKNLSTMPLWSHFF